MSAEFVGASTQYLTNDPIAGLPSSPIPFTIAMWLNLRAVGTVERWLWSYSDTAVTNTYAGLMITTSEVLTLRSVVGGTIRNCGVTTLSANAWVFTVGRMIATNSAKMATLHSNSGLIEHATRGTSSNPSGLDRMTIGALQTSGGASLPWDGWIAEYWLTNTDIQADGAQLQNATLLQLAYGGPFSVPHIAKDLIEYRSFRKSIESDQDEAGEVYHGGAGRQVWTNTNGVTRGPHPPLPGWYRRPNDARLMVPF